MPPAATAPDPVPPLPEAKAPPSWLSKFGYGDAFEWRYVYGGGAPGPAAVWTRPRVPLVAGEPPQPFDRVIAVADSANGVSGELPMGEWLFVPMSLSLALQRHPHGEWTLLEARTTLGDDGLGMTSLRLADADGYLGSAASRCSSNVAQPPAPQDEPPHSVFCDGARRNRVRRGAVRPGVAQSTCVPRSSRRRCRSSW